MDDEEEIGPDLSPPDAIIRLASAQHRFRCPDMAKGQRVSFVRSFKTSGSHPKTKQATSKAQEVRNSLAEAIVGAKNGTELTNESIFRLAREYTPLIHQLLVTCKFQPEVARLDERLFFEWASGIEKDKVFFKSEALMFDLVMSMATEAMGLAASGADACMAGKFTEASRHFKAAAGVMKYLAEDQLPKWLSRGVNVDEKTMPPEASAGVCDAFHILFLAIGQQMVVSNVLTKPGTPNYILLAKLCLGTSEQLEQFASTMRSKASAQKQKMEPSFFSLIAFQIAFQRSLSMYFQARGVWETHEHYGLAISMLSEATVLLRTRETMTARGVPDVDSSKTKLKALSKDLTDMRNHMQTLLRSWETDNSTVYFASVPQSVPDDQRIKKGIMMLKPDPYTLVEPEPLPLSLPEHSTSSMSSEKPPPVTRERSDSDLARELDKMWNK